MKKTNLVIGLVIILFTVLSCSNLLGYGVLLWSIPSANLYSGDIVPVYIKSNISKVYVIGTGEREDQKMELPLWQLSVFNSKRKAMEYAVRLGEFRYTYAETKRDGLPMRANPDNVSDRTYRLKEGQRIKVIRKGTGAPVMSGNSELPGEWLYALTDDGVFGWCYSYSLRLYDEREEGAVGTGVVNTGAETAPDTVLEGILSRNWYPESYRTMQDRNRIDLSQIIPTAGFFPGTAAGVLRIETAEELLTLPYTGITKTEEYTYRFEGTSMTMEQRNSSTLIVQYSDEFGMPKVLTFRTLAQSPEKMIENEETRRAELFEQIQKKSSLFESDNYGIMQFLYGGKFLWSGYQLLTPSIISSGSGSTGRVVFDKFLNASLQRNYDGVITFIFDANGESVDFLYQIDDKGIRMEDIQPANIQNNVAQSRNMSPLVLYFSVQNDITTQDAYDEADLVEYDNTDFNVSGDF